MTLKDWKKEDKKLFFGKDTTVINVWMHKSGDLLFINHIKKEKRYGVFKKMNFTRVLKFFKTKKQALKFAYSYMKKH